MRSHPLTWLPLSQPCLPTKTDWLNTRREYCWLWHRGHCISDMFTCCSTYQSLCWWRVASSRRDHWTNSFYSSRRSIATEPQGLPPSCASSCVCRGSSRSSYGRDSEAFPNCSSETGCSNRIDWTLSDPLSRLSWRISPRRTETHWSGSSSKCWFWLVRIGTFHHSVEPACREASLVVNASVLTKFHLLVLGRRCWFLEFFWKLELFRSQVGYASEWLGWKSWGS